MLSLQSYIDKKLLIEDVKHKLTPKQISLHSQDSEYTQ